MKEILTQLSVARFGYFHYFESLKNFDMKAFSNLNLTKMYLFVRINYLIIFNTQK